MPGVAVCPVAGKLRVDVCPPSDSMLILLQNKSSRSFSHDKSASFRIKGDGSPFRTVCRCECLQGSKSADAKGSNSRFRPSGYHDVTIAVADMAKRIPDGIGGAGTGCHNAGTHPVKAKTYGNAPRGHVGNRPGNKKRRYSVISFFHPANLLFLYCGDPSYSACHTDTPAIPAFFQRLQTGVLHRLTCGHHGVLAEQIHLPDFAPVNPFLYIQIFYFSRQPDLLPGGIVPCNRRNSAPGLFHAFPDLLWAVARRTGDAHAGNHYSSFFHRCSLLFQVLSVFRSLMFLFLPARSVFRPPGC